jgi:D-sedoheptulose 7-phosphate isomerase
MSINKNFEKEIAELSLVLKDIDSFKDEINLIIDSLTKCIKSGKKILICGNGGSAGEANHLAAEFVVRLKPNNNRSGIPMISLSQNSSVLTACGNDYGFEKIFSRTLEALGQEGDVLICLSTSGNSENILKVLDYAKKNKIQSISLLGSRGGKAKPLSNLNLVVPSDNTARIQECHLFLGHFILSEVEKKLFNYD